MKTRYNPWQYITVIAVVAAITFIKVNVSFFQQGLTGTFYLVWITVVALAWDRIAGVLAVVTSVLAFAYVMKPPGFQLNGTAVTDSVELLIAGLLVYVLALRARSLWRENSQLLSVVSELQSIIKSLRRASKGQSRQIDKLNHANSQLDDLVNQFMDSDAYWQAKAKSTPNERIAPRKHKLL